MQRSMFYGGEGATLAYTPLLTIGYEWDALGENFGRLTSGAQITKS